jgi:glycogen debranching enzyme
MVTRWLSNRSRFCVSPEWPFAGQDPVRTGMNDTDISCFWGLPSISADDESYCDGNNGHCGYWRGHTWGPLSMLTYWGLSDPAYQNSTIVSTARKALVRQMREMLGAVWRESHHVCENYSPWKQDVPACTGDPFYHWGGLNALMSVLELELETEQQLLE